MAKLTPQDGVKWVVFIPGTGRFEYLLPPSDSENDRYYDGPELKSPSVQEINRVAPIIALAPNENDRHYDGPELKSPTFQEINRVAPIIAPNYAVDREAKELPRQSNAVDKIFPAPPPSYERLPNSKFSHGATLDIDSKARGFIPKLSIEYKLEPPNNIHLRIKIQNCGYWVSELEFRISFCNGAVILLQPLRTDN